MSEIKATYDNTVLSAKTGRKDVDKAIKSSIQDLYKNIVMLDSAKMLMQSDTMSRYLQRIVNHITEKNASLSGKTYRVFLYRTDEPNASNRGDGIIFFNLDLLCKLGSEAEVAFILCHELAHDQLQHVVDGLKKRSQVFLSPAFKRELKKVKKLEYDRVYATEALYTKYAKLYAEHRRENEFQADSLGLMFFSNAGYRAEASMRTILKLDSVDRLLYNTQLDLARIFHFSSQPFNPEWLKTEGSSSLGSNIKTVYAIDHELKSHPDCAIRAEALEFLVDYHKLRGKENEEIIGQFDKFRIWAQFELLAQYMAEDKYGLALYLALHLREYFPKNIYLKCVIADCFYEILEAQANHRFSRVVDFKSQHFSKEYNSFLVFLHNLDKVSMKGIIKGYFREQVEALADTHSYAGYIEALVSSLDMPVNNRGTIAPGYSQKFTDPYFNKRLTNKFQITKKTSK